MYCLPVYLGYVHSRLRWFVIPCGILPCDKVSCNIMYNRLIKYRLSMSPVLIFRLCPLTANLRKRHVPGDASGYGHNRLLWQRGSDVRRSRQLCLWLSHRLDEAVLAWTAWQAKLLGVCWRRQFRQFVAENRERVQKGVACWPFADLTRNSRHLCVSVRLWRTEQKMRAF